MKKVFTQSSTGVNIGEKFNSPWGRDTGFSLGDLVSNVIVAAMAIAGVVTIFLFVFGGLKIIAGAGSGDSKSTSTGKQAITWAVIGFLVIFTSYWVTQIFTAITGYRLF